MDLNFQVYTYLLCVKCELVLNNVNIVMELAVSKLLNMKTFLN